MNFGVMHLDCPASRGYRPIMVDKSPMEDLTRNPEILDRNVERPFRVFRCGACGLEIKIEKLCGAQS